MAGPQPDGAPAPRDGSLPDEALARMTEPFGIYLHVPFCAVRCGYCDFNTYAPTELPGAAGLAAGFADQLVAELELARRVLPDAGQVDTVFVGGGTPTLLLPQPRQPRQPTNCPAGGGGGNPANTT